MAIHIRQALWHLLASFCLVGFVTLQTLLLIRAHDNKDPVRRNWFIAAYVPALLAFIAPYIWARTSIQSHWSLYSCAVSFFSIGAYWLVNILAITKMEGSDRIILLSLTAVVTIGLALSYKAARSMAVQKITVTTRPAIV